MCDVRAKYFPLFIIHSNMYYFSKNIFNLKNKYNDSINFIEHFPSVFL